MFRIVITVITKSKNFDDDGTRTHILRSEVWCSSFKLHRLMIWSSVEDRNRALSLEYLTVLLQQNGGFYRYEKRFSGETFAQKSCVLKWQFFSSNLWMWDSGLPQRAILHQLSVSKVRAVKVHLIIIKKILYDVSETEFGEAFKK